MVSMAVAVARATRSSVNGTFQRHTSPRVTTLAGSPAGGRWGPPGTFPVLYLGRPTASVIVEAYRHLVDGTEGMSGANVGPRTLWTCHVAATELLDLRDPQSQAAVSLTLEDLTSPVDHYERCQQVAAAAYQLQLHGVIAPSGGGNGETLALFPHHLPAQELPVVVSRETWARLPADPRRLRVLRGGTAEH